MYFDTDRNVCPVKDSKDIFDFYLIHVIQRAISNTTRRLLSAFFEAKLYYAEFCATAVLGKRRKRHYNYKFYEETPIKNM